MLNLWRWFDDYNYMWFLLAKVVERENVVPAELPAGDTEAQLLLFNFMHIKHISHYGSFYGHGWCNEGITDRNTYAIFGGASFNAL